MINAKTLISIALTVFACSATGAAQSDTAATGHIAVTPAGGAAPDFPPPQELVIQVEVPAPVHAVWEAFTTSEGLSTWLTPEAVVDLRPGGEWTAKFPGGSTGGGTIVSFVPEKELVISALAPDRFPHVRAERTKAVFQFESRGSGTVVRLTQSGWKSGPEWTRAYEYLVAGNAQLLSTLHQRFVSGPLDWKAIFGDTSAKKKDTGSK